MLYSAQDGHPAYFQPNRLQFAPGSPFSPSPPTHTHPSTIHTPEHCLPPLHSFIHSFSSLIPQHSYSVIFCTSSRWRQMNGTLFCSLLPTDSLKTLLLPLINLHPALCDLPPRGQCQQRKFPRLLYVIHCCGFARPPFHHLRLPPMGRQQKRGNK